MGRCARTQRACQIALWHWVWNLRALGTAACACTRGRVPALRGGRRSSSYCCIPRNPTVCVCVCPSFFVEHGYRQPVHPSVVGVLARSHSSRSTPLHGTHSHSLQPRDGGRARTRGRHTPRWRANAHEARCSTFQVGQRVPPSNRTWVPLASLEACVRCAADAPTTARHGRQTRSAGLPAASSLPLPDWSEAL